MKRELPEGYTVKYLHRHGVGRIAPRWCLVGFDHLSPVYHGHSTQAVVFDPDGNIAAKGVAMCRPEDQFSKRLGRTIALGRALKKLNKKRAEAAP